MHRDINETGRQRTKEKSKTNWTRRECFMNIANLPFTVLLTRIGLPGSRKNSSGVSKCERSAVQYLDESH